MGFRVIPLFEHVCVSNSLHSFQFLMNFCINDSNFLKFGVQALMNLLFFNLHVRLVHQIKQLMLSLTVYIYHTVLVKHRQICWRESFWTYKEIFINHAMFVVCRYHDLTVILTKVLSSRKTIHFLKLFEFQTDYMYYLFQLPKSTMVSLL